MLLSIKTVNYILCALIILLPGIIISSLTNSTDNNTSLTLKREFIRSLTRNAWNAYTQQYNIWQNGSNCHKTERSMLIAMSTLLVMNLTEEYKLIQKCIENKLSQDFQNGTNRKIKVHDTVTEYLGGLLSSHALTGDRMLLDKAIEVGNFVAQAYHNQTGLPYPAIQNHKVMYDRSSLSEIGGQHLEYRYLTHMTGNQTYRDKVDKIRKVLRNIQKHKGLYGQSILVESGNWSSNIHTDLEINGQHFYSYLVKSFHQSNGTDIEAMEMFEKAINALIDNEQFVRSSNGLVYLREYSISWGIYSGFTYYGCHLGGMLSLAADALERIAAQSSNETHQFGENITRFRYFAEEITQTCFNVSNSTKTKLPPFVFDLDASNQTALGYGVYILTPQLPESYFVLWRKTHEQKYRDYAWALVEAIDRHCKNETNLLLGVINVDEFPTRKYSWPSADVFATLKYLYLTFMEDDVFPLDQWVFNAAGHLLPICGRHQTYQTTNCN